MMKGLIENECGGQNALMKLTSHFTNASEQQIAQDAIRNQRTEMIQPLAQKQNADSFVSEYLGIDQKSNHLANSIMLKRLPAPRTFQMEALLNELKQIDHSQMSMSSTNLANSAHPLLQQQAPKLSTSSLFLNQLNTTSSNNLNANDWSQEYWSSLTAAFQKQSPIILDDRAFKWSAEYLTQTEATIFDES